MSIFKSELPLNYYQQTSRRYYCRPGRVARVLRADDEPSLYFCFSELQTIVN